MLKTRVYTAVAAAPLVVAGVLWLPSFAFLLCAEVVVLMALWEWQHLAGLDRSAARSVAYFALSALGMVLLGLWAIPRGASWLAWLGVLWWCAAAFWLRRPAFGAGAGSSVWKGAAGLLAVLPAWALLGTLHAGTRGPSWVLFLIILIWGADIAAYFGGRHFGGAKLAPVISPKKTWAGVYSALAAGLVIGLVGGRLLGVDGPAFWALLLLALLTVAFSIVGDLFESLIKRQVGVKDSSTLLPGHGGMFDRLDSLFAAVPVFVLGHGWLMA